MEMLIKLRPKLSLPWEVLSYANSKGAELLRLQNGRLINFYAKVVFLLGATFTSILQTDVMQHR